MKHNNIRPKLPSGKGLYWGGDDGATVCSSNLLPQEQATAEAVPFALAMAAIRLGAAQVSGGMIHISFSVPYETIENPPTIRP
jgi:hypothetical protein